MSDSPLRAHRRQSFPFTCGPAALGSVLVALGHRIPRWRDEEIALWRESTAIACPGAHPVALALAARRRGIAAETWIVGPRPWLGAHIRQAHPGISGPGYGAIERSLYREARRARVPVHATLPPMTEGAGLLLATAPSGRASEAGPHWIGLVPVAGRFVVFDPLRRRAYRSARPLGEWWARAGFGGTKSWVALGSPVARASPAASSPAPAAHGSAHRPEVHGPNGTAHGLWSHTEVIARLEAPERARTQDPDLLWDRVGVSTGAIVADVGAGPGFFAVPAARRVGAAGRVYAIDASPAMIARLRERRERDRLPQLRPVRSTSRHIPLRSGVADVVLLANVLHDIPDATLAEAVRLLRPEGRLVNVDWKRSRTPYGPPIELRLSPRAAERRLASFGLRTIDRWTFGPWHYGLVLTRPNRDPARRHGGS